MFFLEKGYKHTRENCQKLRVPRSSVTWVFAKHFCILVDSIAISHTWDQEVWRVDKKVYLN